MERRRFNTSERVAAYLIAGGNCEDCGAELEPGWHGDHDIPYSRGGVTDATNIRALCPKCNLKKGNRRMADEVGSWIDTDPPREWQDEAMDFVRQHSKPDFLAACCPAAGKTVFGLRAAHFKLFGGECDFIIIVVHSDEIRTQWIKEAPLHGINLCRYNHGDGGVQEGFHGCVVTYQQVASQPGLYETLCARYDVVALFDEVHHAGDRMHWGERIKQAFKAAKLRLSLSGTPFRGDNERIPFLNYVEGVCKPDYTYPYWRGIKEKVCRVVEFPAWNADVTWHVYDPKKDTVNSKTVDFDDEVCQDDRAKRLRFALYDDDYLTEMVKAGNGLLQQLRQGGHSNAGGLAIAMNKTHAYQVARVIQRVTGFEPRVVISDSDDASKDIETFRNNAEPWIVAVRMFSEGVSVRRLRVCVYGTNMVTDISFIQAVGRIIRRIGTDDDLAYFVMPKDPLFVSHSSKIEEEVIRAVGEDEEAVDSDDQTPRERRNPSSVTSIPGGTENERHDGSGYRGEFFESRRLEAIESILKESNITVPPIQALALMDKMHRMGLYSQHSSDERRSTAGNKSKATKLDRTTNLRNVVYKRAQKYAIFQSKLTGQSPSYSRVFKQLDDLVGRDYKTGSEEELSQCLRWLERHIEAIEPQIKDNGR